MTAKAFDVDFVNNPSLVQEGVSLACTRGSNAMVADAEGLLRRVDNNIPRFPGAILNHNLMLYSDYNVSAWTTAVQGLGVAPVLVTENYSTNSDGVQMSRYTFEAGGTAVGDRSKLRQSTSPASIIEAQHKFTASIWLATLSGTETVVMSAGGRGQTNKTVTTTPTRFEVTAVCTTTNSPGIEIYIQGSLSGASPIDLLVGGMMVEDVSGKADTSASAFIPTSGAAVHQYSGTSLGWLGEPAATNLLKNSNWAAGGGSAITANSGIAPDGSTTSILLEGSGGGSGTVAAFVVITTAVSGDNIFSVYIEPANNSWVNLETAAFDAGGNGDTYFDLTTPSVGTQSANHIDAGIEELPSGLLRCWVKFNTITDLNGNVLVYIADADGDRTVTRDSSSSLYLSAGQVEDGAGLERPSSYIPTTTATVTRSDEYSSGAISGMNASEGSLYIKTKKHHFKGSTNYLVRVDDGTNANRVYMFTNGSIGNLRFATVTSGTAEIAMNNTANPLALDQEFGSVLGWALNDSISYIDGIEEATDTTYDAPDQALSQLVLGASAGSSIWNGLIERAVGYDSRLTDTQLELLSQGTLPTFGRDLMDYSLTFPLTGSLPIVPTYRWDYE